MDLLELHFEGEIWEWRGPAPYYFVTVPEDEAAELHEVAAAVTYGWGVVPVRVTIGGTEWTTSLFPKDGGYVLPLKDRVRKAEGIGEGDTISVTMTLA
ncbi:DUF1905 domain-containing protein [Kribbella capetownensis]|uniref:DUF1905 domain-containing protein n=1 Tax=Kribbella capetownensis TaxID=1572659 RepID=UPI001EDCC2E3|nr:DUF1905 domain-containing protein [Kribbella capetownensis]